MKQVPVPPTGTLLDSGLQLFVTLRSADSPAKLRSSEAVLLPLFGSDVVVDTLAVSLTVSGAGPWS